MSRRVISASLSSEQRNASSAPAAPDLDSDGPGLPPLGGTLVPGGARFCVFAQPADRCSVRLFTGEQSVEHEMRPRGDGFFTLDLPGPSQGALYKFVVDGREMPDPCARFLPQGVHGPAMLVRDDYAWRFGEGVHRPLEDHVIYELHGLIDEAHRRGLAVLLDVVYNHFGPAGNYLPSYAPAYFTSDRRNAWGDAPDYGHPALRRMIVENARYWLRDFRFDGLRLDATHAIVDTTSPDILSLLAGEIGALRPPKLLIAEDNRNDCALVRDGGMHAIWADDFHHQLRVTMTGEQDGYYAAYRPGLADLARTIEQGWLYQGELFTPTGERRGCAAGDLDAPAFVYCIQNHDQIGNRALGDRLNAAVNADLYRAASVLLLFLPMTPLLFMGQEWAASAPFLFFTDHDPELGRLVSEGRREEFKAFEAFKSEEGRRSLPDPQREDTFLRSKQDWDERERDEHGRVLRLYQLQ